MIPGHRFLDKLDDPLHQDQHRFLFANVQGVIEKVATTAPSLTTLPVGYIQFALISGTYYIYVNINGVLVKWEGAAA